MVSVAVKCLTGVISDLGDSRSVEAGIVEGVVERFAISSVACLKVLWITGNLIRCCENCGGGVVAMMCFVPEVQTLKGAKEEELDGDESLHPTP